MKKMRFNKRVFYFCFYIIYFIYIYTHLFTFIHIYKNLNFEILIKIIKKHDNIGVEFR